MVKMVMLPALAVSASAQVTLMVFGDSFGDTGPTFHQVQDMFNSHGIDADVRSAAIGGTQACGWASEENGQQMVLKAQELFPDLADGPDYVWYTLGGNDVWADDDVQQCLKEAKGDATAGNKCIDDFTTKLIGCHSTMFDIYQAKFPKSKILQAGYDVPCNNLLCQISVNKAFVGNYCGADTTCLVTTLDYWNRQHLTRMQAKYPTPGYTSINLIGGIQKAEGLEGADYGKPILSKQGKCTWTTLCIHPTYNSPAGIAYGEGMWEFYFSKEFAVATNSSVVV
jgi:hypothetical protein